MTRSLAYAAACVSARLSFCAAHCPTIRLQRARARNFSSSSCANFASKLFSMSLKVVMVTAPVVCSSDVVRLRSQRLPDGPQSMHASESTVALMIVGCIRQIVFGILQAEVDRHRVNLVV